jgi:hypothetical protein
VTPGRLPILATLVAAASLGAAWVALRPGIEVRPDSGDWRGISTGLRRSRVDGALRGGPRAVIHVHDLDGRLRRLDIRLSALPGAGPLPTTLRTRRGVAFSGDLTVRGATVSADFPPGLRDAEVWIEAATTPGSTGSVFRVHDIVLARRTGPSLWIGILLPPLLGVTTLLLLSRRWGRRMAVACGLLAAALTVGLWLAAVDPPLRSHPARCGKGSARRCWPLWGIARRARGLGGASHRGHRASHLPTLHSAVTTTSSCPRSWATRLTLVAWGPGSHRLLPPRGERDVGPRLSALGRVAPATTS